MKTFALNMFYKTMYIWSYFESFYNNYIKQFTLSNFITDEPIVSLINSKIPFNYVLDDLDSDIDMDFEFGIIEKYIGDKKCQFMFLDDIDMDDIPEIFTKKTESVILSASIEIKDVEESVDLDITTVNYFFENNVVFFKQHIAYLLYKDHLINVNESDYTITIIDNKCDIVSFNQDQFLQFTSGGGNIYEVKSRNISVK